MNKIISVILCLTFLLGITIGVSGVAVNAATVDVAKTSSNQTNIVDRANYMYNATWVCQQTVSGWSGTFYAGNTYRAPYGQPVYSGRYIGFTSGGAIDDSTIATYLTAANTAGSVFYTGRSHCGGTTAPYWATDCSAFVSWCWGISRTTTYGIPNVATYIGAVSTTNATYSLQLGDALNDYDSHVVLVTGLTYNSSGAITQIEITEQTPPQLKRSYYTPAQLSNKYYSNYSIYRYTGTVPLAPDSAKWVSDGTGYKYQYANGSYASGWTKINGEDYYFGSGNYMFTGWLNDNGKWYYFNPHNGIMQRGWFQVDGIWYYFDSNGVMQTGWVEPESGKWYYLNDDGSRATGWIIPDGITTYYMNPDTGIMATGWTSIDGVWHEFSPWGVYYHNTALDLGDTFTAVITPNSAPDKALSLDGNNVELRTKDNSDDQIWTFEKQSDGSYKIINKSNEWCMDVQDSLTCNGANVQTWQDNGADAQRWVITKEDGNEGYTLRPVNAINNGKVMDVINAETADGTNIVLSGANGGSNQQFTFNIIGSHIIGDADCDTEVSIADVTYIQEYVAGIITEEVNVLADVNGNGKIDIRDATYIQMYLAKVIDKFPCES